MPRALQMMFFLLLGLACGWLLRGLYGGEPLADSPAVGWIGEAGDPVAASPAPDSPRSQSRPAPPQDDLLGIVSRLQQLLAQQRFEAAMALYEDTVAAGSVDASLLRPLMEDHLAWCMERCAEGEFVGRAELWLGNYYDDIRVILLLAEYQRRQGYPEEAAGLAQMARAYAYQPGQAETVERFIQHLQQRTDAAYREEQRWIELLGFYEYLRSLGIERPAFLLRQALLYAQLGEPTRSRRLLLQLQASDTGADPEISRQLALLLAEPEPEVEPEPQPIPASAVPLQRRGDHYLLQVSLNDEEQLTLMIDTGASITALHRSSFKRLRRPGYSILGSRMFSTANGMARGDVYRARSLQLGEYRLEAPDLAVLDFRAEPGVDGLLGMNVLRNFRFEIDQDRNLLYLKPR